MNPGAENSRVIVVGGGIGGLSTALALQRAGIPVTVCEASPELLEVGAGIQVWVNGVAALDRLGVADAVEAAGSAMESEEFRSWRGQTLMKIPAGELARKHGVRLPLTVGRGELVGVLADALEPGVLELNAACVGFEQDDAGVTVRIADGRELRAAALIAADGVDSRIRAQAFPDAPAPAYAGYQYLRAITHFAHPAAPEGLFRFTLGPKDRFGVKRMAGGAIYWFGVVVVPEGTGDRPEGRKAELLERFRGYPEPVVPVIDSTPEEAIYRTDIRDLPPLDTWVDGRVVLMGDAAHATTPNLGRGAGEAIEDAVVLAAVLHGIDLADGEPVAAALRRFEAARRGPTAAVQKEAHKIGAMLSWGHPRARMREVVMKHIAAKQSVKKADEEFAAMASA